MSSADYVARAGAIDLFVIRASELAASRASQLRTREVAHRLLTNRQGTSQQLSFAGRRLNLLPSAKLPAPLEERLQRIASAPDFDAAYRQEMALALEQSLQLHRIFARSGSSPTLVPVAAHGEGAAERDLRLLGYL